MFENEGQKELANQLVTNVVQVAVPRNKQRRVAMLSQDRRQILKGNARLKTHLPYQALGPEYVGLKALHIDVERKTVLQQRYVSFRVDLERRRNHAYDQLTAVLAN